LVNNSVKVDAILLNLRRHLFIYFHITLNAVNLLKERKTVTQTQHHNRNNLQAKRRN